MCLDSVKYNMHVNRHGVGLNVPHRGLRQGDPLSPYLFIHYCEGLTSLIQKAEARGHLHGIKVCRGVPSLSHLLFANDCFLFFRVDSKESICMKKIFSFYEKEFGQAINLEKSEIFFLSRTPLLQILKMK